MTNVHETLFQTTVCFPGAWPDVTSSLESEGASTVYGMFSSVYNC